MSDDLNLIQIAVRVGMSCALLSIEATTTERVGYEKAIQFTRLRDLVKEGFDIRLALDDDPKNHAMYVSEGVPCIYIHSGYYL